MGLANEIGDQGEAQHDDNANNRRHTRQLEGGAVNDEIKYPLGKGLFLIAEIFGRDCVQRVNFFVKLRNGFTRSGGGSG
jgi:hypothetical protein